MKPAKTIFMFLLLSFLAANLFAQDMDEMEKKIIQWNNQMEEALLENDTEKMLSFYADDVISMPSYSPMIMGKDKLKEAMMKDMGNKMTKFELESKEIFNSGELLIDVGEYDLTMEMAGMENPINDNGKYVTVYEKQDDGEWKVKLETWNSDKNPWMDNFSMDNTENQNMDKKEMKKENNTEEDMNTME